MSSAVVPCRLQDSNDSTSVTTYPYRNFHFALASSSSVSRRSFTSSAAIMKDYPPHTLFPMPALSPTMEVGTISSWTKAVGEQFGAGDVICEIETDKASVDFEAQDDGILAKILIDVGMDVPVGTPICVVVEEADDVAAFSDFEVPAVAGTVEPVETAAAPAAVAETADPPTVSTGGAANMLMPSARHMAESKGFDATGLVGSAKGGRVTKGDVLLALAAGSLPPLQTAAVAASVAEPAATAATATATVPAPALASAPAPSEDLAVPMVDSDGHFEDLPNNKMRKIIASRLTESKRDVPHYYTAMEVQLDSVLALRKKLAANHDVKVSVNDFIIRCCALALRDVPEVNATYDAKTDAVRLQESIDVSVAVATPTGLITPIVFNTDKLGLSEITNTIRDLAGRAREGKLKPQEYQGGTFSVSNLGMFGIDEFSAVINPPQAAILAVGGGSRRIVPTPYVDGAKEQAKPFVQTIMTARLSADRRVVDEATAALFLSAFKHYITQPELLLL